MVLYARCRLVNLTALTGSGYILIATRSRDRWRPVEPHSDIEQVEIGGADQRAGRDDRFGGGDGAFAKWLQAAAPIALGGVKFYGGGEHLLQQRVRDRIGIVPLQCSIRQDNEITLKLCRSAQLCRPLGRLPIAGSRSRGRCRIGMSCHDDFPQ